MQVPLIYYIDGLHGSPGQVDALLRMIRDRGALGAHELDALLDAIGHALDAREQREQELERAVSDAESAIMSKTEFALVSGKIADAFARLGERHPALEDELHDAAVELIEEIRTC